MPRFKTRPADNWDFDRTDRCAVHEDRKATFVITTEFSAFGNEEELACTECKDAYVKSRSEPQTGYCDRCGNTEGVDVFPWQDPEEGSSAVFLDTCKHCRA